MTQVPPPSPQPVVPVCYRHPKREAHVRCTRCDRPICPDCMKDAAVGHQCPECVADGRRTIRQGRTVFGGGLSGGLGYVTITLISINVVMLLISIASAGGQGIFGGGAGGIFSGFTPLLSWGGVDGQTFGIAPGGQRYLIPIGVADGEYYRLLTAMFLHFGPIHLLLNMWALWFVGRTLEAALGPLRFAVLYLVAGLGGNVAAYLFSPTVLTAGASGAIFGLFAAYFVVLRRLRRDTSAIVPVVVVTLVISLAPGISLAGHLGGLVAGGVLAFIMAYAPVKHRSQIFAAATGGLLVLMAIIVMVQTSALQAPVPI